MDFARLAARAARSRATVKVASVPKGVTVLDLATAARDHEDLVRAHLGATVRADGGRVEALAAALWTAGVLVHVPRGVEAADPVVLETAAPADGALSHVLVVAEPRSRVSVVERLRSPDSDALVAGAVEVVPMEGAHVQYASVQELGRGVTHWSAKRAVTARDSNVTWIDAQLGASLLRGTVDTRLVGVGSSTKNLGAFFGTGKQRFDLSAGAWHVGRHTSSELTAKGALAGESFAIYAGTVNIGHEAPESSGHLHETTLLLDETARADAIPKLDVENNNVSASHAAAVGQIDPDQLFYIRSRGLDERAARRTIVEGFFEPLLRQIPLPDLADELGHGIARRVT